MATCRPRAPIFRRCCEGVEGQNVTVEYHGRANDPARPNDLVFEIGECSPS